MEQPELNVANVEALIFTSENGLSFSDLQQYFYTTESSDFSVLEGILASLVLKYCNAESGIDLLRTGDRYQFVTKEAAYYVVQKMQSQRIQRSLGQASMETLAIVAYRQPCLKSDIESIRGVNCDYSIERLLEKNLIMISGQSDMPGKPLIYITTPTFKDYLGINSLDELPHIKEIPARHFT